MRRSVMCFWMSAGTLGMALALGCSHSGSGKGVTETSQPPLARRSSRPIWGEAVASSPRKVQEGPDLPEGPGPVVSPYHTMAQPRLMTQASLPAKEEEGVRVVQIDRKPELELLERQPVPVYSLLDDKPVRQSRERRSSTDLTANPGFAIERQPVPAHSLLDDQPVRQSRERRSYTDLTANPAFAHDKQYRWLIGVVEMNKKSRNWEIRYASVDEEDAYGGRLRLVHGDPPPPLVEGQLVRVEGWVAERTSPPVYRVQNIWLYSQP